MVRSAGQIDGAGPSPFHDAPFYDVYTCSDGGCITIAALEPQFHALLLAKLGLTDVAPAAQYHTTTWPALKARLAALFASHPRAHWCALLEGTDVCFAPVLSLAEAACHPHNRARGNYRAHPTGTIEAMAAPRFQALSGGS
jgi:alpha-methylacyl-CoA racemase